MKNFFHGFLIHPPAGQVPGRFTYNQNPETNDLDPQQEALSVSRQERKSLEQSIQAQYREQVIVDINNTFRNELPEEFSVDNFPNILNDLGFKTAKKAGKKVEKNEDDERLVVFAGKTPKQVRKNSTLPNDYIWIYPNGRFEMSLNEGTKKISGKDGIVTKVEEYDSSIAASQELKAGLTNQVEFRKSGKLKGKARVDGQKVSQDDLVLDYKESFDEEVNALYKDMVEKGAYCNPAENPKCGQAQELYNQNFIETVKTKPAFAAITDSDIPVEGPAEEQRIAEERKAMTEVASGKEITEVDFSIDAEIVINDFDDLRKSVEDWFNHPNTQETMYKVIADAVVTGKGLDDVYATLPDALCGENEEVRVQIVAILDVEKKIVNENICQKINDEFEEIYVEITEKIPARHKDEGVKDAVTVSEYLGKKCPGIVVDKELVKKIETYCLHPGQFKAYKEVKDFLADNFDIVKAYLEEEPGLNAGEFMIGLKERLKLKNNDTFNRLKNEIVAHEDSFNVLKKIIATSTADNFAQNLADSGLLEDDFRIAQAEQARLSLNDSFQKIQNIENLTPTEFGAKLIEESEKAGNFAAQDVFENMTEDELATLQSVMVLSEGDFNTFKESLGELDPTDSNNIALRTIASLIDDETFGKMRDVLGFYGDSEADIQKVIQEMTPDKFAKALSDESTLLKNDHFKSVLQLVEQVSDDSFNTLIKTLGFEDKNISFQTTVNEIVIGEYQDEFNQTPTENKINVTEFKEVLSNPEMFRNDSFRVTQPDAKLTPLESGTFKELLKNSEGDFNKFARSWIINEDSFGAVEQIFGNTGGDFNKFEQDLLNINEDSFGAVERLFTARESDFATLYEEITDPDKSPELRSSDFALAQYAAILGGGDFKKSLVELKKIEDNFKVVHEKLDFSENSYLKQKFEQIYDFVDYDEDFIQYDEISGDIYCFCVPDIEEEDPERETFPFDPDYGIDVIPPEGRETIYRWEKIGGTLGEAYFDPIREEVETEITRTYSWEKITTGGDTPDYREVQTWTCEEVQNSTVSGILNQLLGLSWAEMKDMPVEYRDTDQLQPLVDRLGTGMHTIEKCCRTYKLLVTEDPTTVAEANWIFAGQYIWVEDGKVIIDSNPPVATGETEEVIWKVDGTEIDRTVPGEFPSSFSDELRARFEDYGSGGETSGSVTETETNVEVINIAPYLYYDVENEDRLDANDGEIIKKYAEKFLELKASNPGLKIQLDSFCSTTASDSYNKDLSKRRNSAVKNYLITQMDIAESDIIATDDNAHGEDLTELDRADDTIDDELMHPDDYFDGTRWRPDNTVRDRNRVSLIRFVESSGETIQWYKKEEGGTEEAIETATAQTELGAGYPTDFSEDGGQLTVPDEGGEYSYELNETQQRQLDALIRNIEDVYGENVILLQVNIRGYNLSGDEAKNAEIHAKIVEAMSEYVQEKNAYIFLMEGTAKASSRNQIKIRRLSDDLDRPEGLRVQSLREGGDTEYRLEEDIITEEEGPGPTGSVEYEEEEEDAPDDTPTEAPESTPEEESDPLLTALAAVGLEFLDKEDFGDVKKMTKEELKDFINNDNYFGSKWLDRDHWNVLAKIKGDTNEFRDWLESDKSADFWSSEADTLKEWLESEETDTPEENEEEPSNEIVTEEQPTIDRAYVTETLRAFFMDPEIDFRTEYFEKFPGKTWPEMHAIFLSDSTNAAYNRHLLKEMLKDDTFDYFLREPASFWEEYRMSLKDLKLFKAALEKGIINKDRWGRSAESFFEFLDEEVSSADHSKPREYSTEKVLTREKKEKIKDILETALDPNKQVSSNDWELLGKYVSSSSTLETNIEDFTPNGDLAMDLATIDDHHATAGLKANIEFGIDHIEKIVIKNS